MSPHAEATLGTQVASEQGTPAAGPDAFGRASKRRRLLAAAAVLVMLGASGATALQWGRIQRLWHGTPAGSSSGSAPDNGSPVSTATVVRRGLTAQQQVDGVLGYAGTYTVLGTQSGGSAGPSGAAGLPSGSSPAPAPGMLTWAPDVGQVVKAGQPVYEVDGTPVDLLYGTTPAYRDLSEGATGKDVAELNTGLVALGYASRSRLDPASDTFTAATAGAVMRLQDRLGVAADGVLHLGQVVFLPTALRVAAVLATVGGPATGPILRGTSTTRQVVVNLDASRQSEVRPGDQVDITMPGGRVTPGTVTKVGTVASTATGASGSAGASGAGSGGSAGTGSAGTPTVPVDIAPSDPAATGTVDQGPVQVQITTATVPDAVVVPVTALLSLSGGGYAVEVVEPGGARRLVGVGLGLFDDADGLVQVTGTSLRAGQKVVVAGS